MIKQIKDAIKSALAEAEAEGEKQIMIIDPKGAEPDLRVVGLFTDVTEEKIAEVVHGL